MTKVKFNFLNRFTHSWATPIIKKAAKDDLANDDFPELTDSYEQMTAQSAPFFHELKLYLDGVSPKPPSLYWHLFKIYRKEILSITILKLISMLVSGFKPLLIGQFISFLDPTAPHEYWFNSISIVLGLLLLTSVCIPTIDSFTNGIDGRFRARFYMYFYTMMYEKILRLSANSRIKFETGNLINMFDRDSFRVIQGLTIMNTCVFPIVQITTNLIFLQSLIGLTALFTGICYFTLLVPVIFLQMKLQKLSTTVHILQDSRLNILEEVFKNIKKIKLSNIQDYFYSIVKRNLDKEMGIWHKLYIVNRLCNTVMGSFTTILSCSTFVIYSILGNTMNPHIIFPTYLYLDSIAGQFQHLRRVFGSSLDTYEGYAIVTDILHSEERPEQIITDRDSSNAIVLKKVTWKWCDPVYVKKLHDHELKKKRYIREKKDEFTEKENLNTFELKGVNVVIKKGERIGIVGAVGAGKSTLFNGLTRELIPKDGKMEINGTIAYFTQEHWIMMDSMKTNITFGKELDYEKLERIVKACCLVKDINSFEDGINSMLGESGINLSGGQKARVSLARCIYSEADIYLLDDPLAALDAYVGRQVFERAVKGELAGKTVLLSTHQLQYMNQMDKIIVLDKGQVVEFGTFDELKNTENGIFKNMIENHKYDDIEEFAGVEEEELLYPLSEIQQKPRELIKEDSKKTGDIKWHLYTKLFDGITSNLWFISMGWFVWSNDSSRDMFYIGILSASTGLRLLVFYSVTFGWFIGGINNHKYFYSKMTTSVLNAPQYFFEENPIGRVLSRFSTDLRIFNHVMFDSMQQIVTGSLSFIGKNVLVCLASPYLIVLLMFVYSIIWTIRGVFESAIVRITRSMLVSLYQSRGCERNDNNHQFSKYFNLLQNESWYQFRVSIINLLISFGIIGAAMLSNTKSTIFSSLVALALTQSETCSAQLLDLVRSIAQNKSQMNSFERVLEYCEEIDQEPAKTLDTDPKEWPIQGEIQIADLTMAYHSKPEVDVLKNINLSIKAGEKIGVVGRTGSGKSTLAMAFFRIMEPKSGTIIIDGTDITKIGISTLRSNLFIISQEANVFTGTIRYNLSLDTQYSDEELWEALHLVGLKEYVSQLPDKLDHQLVDNGSNLSVGQGQLLCLARAIAKKPKVLILDEASSSIDGEADKKLQQVLRKELVDTTIISIAHRLNTIADFDRVMVLDQGELVEFDSPFNLLSDQGSEFSKLVDASGSANSVAIREIAEHKHRSNKA
ncbi:Canalicular multispecific organic anion transporter 2 [Boothiomyces macroporosus]|uniref:Canalicular multispecific organic anion transporter 2 n=1 Tax=Boothiomyces macroporosus TaxID=261099 RepID=A0AAD5Y4L5_9FUNG|nr:Canalicular multispecific organic anion transporter 2 [Boothiomyces macroporosus]